jgi:AraC-like DNA-binding protein
MRSTHGRQRCVRASVDPPARARAGGADDQRRHARGRLAIERLSLLVYLVASSSTLADGIRQAERFLCLRDESVEMRLVDDGDAWRWIASPSYLGLARDRPGMIQHTINLVATCLQVARVLTGVTLAPLSVAIAAPRPARTDELERFFAAPPRFEAPLSALTLSKEQLALPMRKADPALLAVLTRHAEEILTRLPLAPGRWIGQVRRALIESLHAGDSDLSRVAKRFAVTPRTLQRRLREEGSSFQTLLDGARQELALRYLRDPGRTASEVAYMLGFREASAFCRAFHRWTGVTPAAFRRSNDVAR